MKIIEEFEKNEHSLWQMLKKTYNIDLDDLLDIDVRIKIADYAKELDNYFVLEQEKNNNYLKTITYEQEKNISFQ